MNHKKTDSPELEHFPLFIDIMIASYFNFTNSLYKKRTAAVAHYFLKVYREVVGSYTKYCRGEVSTSAMSIQPSVDQSV